MAALALGLNFYALFNLSDAEEKGNIMMNGYGLLHVLCLHITGNKDSGKSPGR